MPTSIEPKIHLTVTPPASSEASGHQLEFVLTIHNTGDAAGHYHVGITNLLNQRYDLPTTYTALSPEATTAIPLTVHLDTGAALREEHYPFTVVVTVEEAADAYAAATVDLTVDADGVAHVGLPEVMLWTPRGSASASMRSVRPAAVRRVLVWAMAPVLLIGVEALLAFHVVNLPTAPTSAAAALIATHKTSRGGIARMPSIARFVLEPAQGGRGQSAALSWSTRNATQVTLNGTPVRTQGTRVLRLPAHSTLYKLVARNKGRLVTAQVHVPGIDPLMQALSLPVALFNANEVVFGPRAIRATGRTQTVRIVNLGPPRLKVTNVAIGGTNRRDFAERDTCARHTINVDAGCTISVDFTPRGAGARRASLIVIDNTATSPHTIALSGRGRP